MNVKVSQDNKGNLSKKNFSFDANLTLPFGEVSSIFSREMNPRSSIKVHHKDLVRLNPLVSPTFGRVYYKTWSRFVPYKEIWEPMDQFLTSQKFNSGLSSYIPTKVPQVSIRQLTAWILTQRDGIRTSVPFLYVSSGESNASSSVFTVKNLHLATAAEKSTLVNDESFIDVFRGFSGIDLDDSSFINDLLYDSPSNPSACDFTYGLTASVSGLTYTVVVGWKLTHFGKHLRTILMSLGYGLTLESSRMVSILPLVSWYKGYYDLFVPSHNGTSANVWTDTNAFALMKRMVDYNFYDVNNADSTVLTYWQGLLKDICLSYYYQKSDFFTSHVSQPSITNNVSTPNYSVSRTGMSSGTSVGLSINGLPALSTVNAGVSNIIIADTIRMLLKFTPFINIDTVLGGRIDKLMRSKFGDNYKSMFISYDGGRGSTFCQIDDVMSNADTATSDGGAFLGEYAGKGIGTNVNNGKGDFFKYRTDTLGIFIVYCSIVPESKFVNGLDYNLLHGTDNKWSFWTPRFDALGNVVNQKDILIGNNYNFFNYSSDDESSTYLSNQNYGLISRYAEIKAKPCGLNTGDLSLPSMFNSMASFTLDKLMFHTVNSYSETQFFEIDRGPVNVANPEYLTIGKYTWLGGYNRIFTEDSTTDYATRWSIDPVNYVGKLISPDNFIIHNILDVEYYGPELPLDESFDTDGEGKSLEVDKL